jgi:hypothetical protein
MNLNPLAENAAARKAVYILFWFASLVLGGIGAGYGAADAGIPGWYAPAAAVYAFLAAAVGYQAASNTDSQGQ